MRRIGIILLVLLLAAAPAMAEILQVDMETATIEELEGYIEQLHARIGAIEAARLGAYPPAESLEALVAWPAGEAVRYAGRVGQVAKGISTVEVLIAFEGFSTQQTVAIYATSAALPALKTGDTVLVLGEHAGVADLDGQPTPIIAVHDVQPYDAGALDVNNQSAPGGEGESFSAQGYTWEMYGSHRLALAVRNNTADDVEIGVRLIFKDGDGNMIGVKNLSERAFEAGTDMVFVTSNDAPFASFEYEITASPDRYYAGVRSSLQEETLVTGNKAIVTAKNVGDKAAKFVECYVLFMSGDQVVDYDWRYLTDSDSEIKPGKSELGEFSTREAFDHVQVYLMGRADKDS